MYISRKLYTFIMLILQVLYAYKCIYAFKIMHWKNFEYIYKCIDACAYFRVKNIYI